MKKRMLLGGLVSLFALAVIAGSASAQSSSSVSMRASSVNGVVDVCIGGFVFETGSRVGLEFIQDGAADCFGPDAAVERLVLLDAADAVIRETNYDLPAAFDSWLGRIELIDPAGRPLSPGTYRAVIHSTVGVFTAEIEVADTSHIQRLGSYSATATVCGLTLRVYRLMSEEDTDARITLRIGDRLMIALEGNPTTGYEWMNTLLYEFETLREIREVEFRPDSTLLGAGGLFLFRYEAVAEGPQAFRLVYARPWESVQPANVLEFSANVY